MLQTAPVCSGAAPGRKRPCAPLNEGSPMKTITTCFDPDAQSPPERDYRDDRAGGRGDCCCWRWPAIRPTDPSFNTVGHYVTGRPAHNWTGMVGAYLSDAMLQLIGVAAFFLPLVLGRLGLCWMRSRPAGSPMAKTVGPGDVGGLCTGGDCVASGAHDVAALRCPSRERLGGCWRTFMVHYLNLPGACYRAGADGRAVALSGDDVYVQYGARVGDDPVRLCTGDVGSLGAVARADAQARNLRSKRRTAASASRPMRRLGERVNWPKRRSESSQEPESTTLLGSLFGWLGQEEED